MFHPVFSFAGEGWGEKLNNKPQTEQEVTMSIIRIKQERIKASDETDIDVIATELLGLKEFVVESYENGVETVFQRQRI